MSSNLMSHCQGFPSSPKLKQKPSGSHLSLAPSEISVTSSGWNRPWVRHAPCKISRKLFDIKWVQRFFYPMWIEFTFWWCSILPVQVFLYRFLAHVFSIKIFVRSTPLDSKNTKSRRRPMALVSFVRVRRSNCENYGWLRSGPSDCSLGGLQCS